MTALPYWGIVFLIIINAVIVSRMKVDVTEAEENEVP